MGQANFLESRGAGQAKRESTALMNSNRGSLPAKHPIANLARLSAGTRILDDLVESLRDLTKPEFQGELFLFPANLKFQPIAGPLFLQPALGSLWHFSTVPGEDHVSRSQARMRCRTIGINRAYHERPVLLVF
jgi:hypothetical protein